MYLPITFKICLLVSILLIKRNSLLRCFLLLFVVTKGHFEEFKGNHSYLPDLNVLCSQRRTCPF